MKKLTSDAAENLSRKFRADVGFSAVEPISTKSILRKKNILTIYKPLSDNFYGLSLKSNGGNCFMLINSNTTRGRQHFTVGHELYHLFYDGNPAPHVCGEDFDGKETSEKNADLFASALLMPKEGILQFTSPEEITRKNVTLANVIKLEQYYAVSRQSLLFRLKALDLLTQSNLQNLLQIPVVESAKQYGYDIALYKKGNENLVIGDFGEKARTLYDSGKISEGHYLELLNLIANGDD